MDRRKGNEWRGYVPRVLVADDEEDVRILIRMVLEARGYRIVGEAANGGEAVSKAFRLNPDVITIDHQMPYLTGERALEHIREIRPDAKIVVVSGTLEEQPDWAEHFLPKWRIAELADVLDDLLS